MSEYRERLGRKLRQELGQPVLSALEDPAVIEVMLNPSGELWVERFGKPMERAGGMTPANASALLGTVASSLETTITRERPVVEGELILDGSRIEGLVPPVVSAPAFCIRKRASAVFPLEDYVRSGAMTPRQRDRLRTAVAERRNILVVGGTGSGKTTLVNALIGEVTQAHPEDRIVLIEDTVEIQCAAENVVALRTSPEVSMRDLLRATMRLRPDRILVGEVRGGEALDLLKSWNTGHPGGIATVHANGCLAGLVRLEQLVREAGVASGMEPLIGEAVDLAVAIERCAATKAGRRVAEIAEVSGHGPDGYRMTSEGQADG